MENGRNGKDPTTVRALMGQMRLVLPRSLSIFVIAAVFFSLLVAPAAAQEVRSRQWYLEPMQAEKIWQISTGENITVAVLDNEIDPSVPELRGQVAVGKDFSDGSISEDEAGKKHGTNMSVLIAGRQSGNGVQGLAPGARVLPVIMGDRPDFSTVARSIRYAADQGAQIINISYASSAVEDLSALRSAVDYANKKGSLIFSAAGNHGDESNVPYSPADLPGVVAVGAIDQSLSIAKFSAYGSHLALTAPGVDIPTWCTESTGYCSSEGTSQATALTSASAALIWSEHPDWTNNQVLRVMMETAGKPSDGKVPSPYFGYGVVRPRTVLLDGEGNPGDPNVNPLISAQTPSESPSPSGDGKGGGTATETSQKPEETADEADSDGVPLGLILGGTGVAVVIVIGATVGIVRSRQRVL